jgi:serine/threonine-protein kinase
MKPGVVIRNEEMARDLGRHFPPDTDYLVLWGTMSPRTAGWYRPHLTCVQKKGDTGGVSASFELELQSKELPLPDDKAKDQRESFNRLIGVTCAAVPGCYAAHKINRDQVPDLGKFYEFLGKDEPETVRFRSDLEPLTRWYRTTDPGYRHLRRISEIRANQPYPPVVVNDRDDAVMVLITDASGQPRRFMNPATGKEEIVYIDMLETTTGQFVKFLNARGGNKEEGGVRWTRIEPDFTDMEEKDGRFVLRNGRAQFAVMNVNWFGAGAYCRWAGKELPREEEWRAAAAPAGEGKYPWGAGFDKPEALCNCAQSNKDNAPGGRFPRDRSRVNCLDMAGNVAEWCEDYFQKGDPSRRVVCGGSFLDKEAKDFEVTARRAVDQVKHERWVGFRGVVRIPVDKQDR